MSKGIASSVGRGVHRLLLPLGVFSTVVAIHYLWLGFFPERDPAQERWVTVVSEPSWLQRYVETQSYWLSLSYGLSLAFAVHAFRRYREDRLCAARTSAIGGVTLSGFLAVAGCYLAGCCGSPMLGVYLSLFGATFLPFTKPLVALLTVLSLAVAWWWMNRRRSVVLSVVAEASCNEAQCGCGWPRGGSQAHETPEGIRATVQ